MTPAPPSRPRVCHLSSVHDCLDTRVFHRECVSLARWYDVTFIGHGTAQQVREGVRLVPLPRPRNRLARMTASAFRAYRLARSTRADLFHFHDPELIPWARLLAATGRPVVYDIHENVVDSLRHKAWLPFGSLFAGLYARIEPSAARSFEFVLAERSYEAAYRRSYPWKSCEVVENFSPPGFIRQHRQLERPVEPLRLFYMGSIDHLYCLLPMLESIRVLRARGVRAQLVMVGKVDGTIRHELEQRGALDGIRDQVELHGFREFSEGYALSRGCALGYCFVSDNVNVSESVPRKLYEYMQVGLPVVSSGHPLYRSVVEGNGLGVCVEACTGERIADAVERMAGDPASLHGWAASAARAADTRFDWHAQAEKLHRLYERLLAGDRPARGDGGPAGPARSGPGARVAAGSA